MELFQFSNLKEKENKIFCNDCIYRSQRRERPLGNHGR